MKKQVGSFIGGAVATAAIPFGYGVINWKVLAASAAVGGVGALCGVNVPVLARRYMAKRKAGVSAPPP